MGRWLQAELGYGEIYLTFSRARPIRSPFLPARRATWTLASFIWESWPDGLEALAVAGWGLRSVNQGRAKDQPALR
ncbi:MAG: hypothetical protein OWU84_02825 [Firmicutes bacterium]|nr:hypothetical protein [Bacillota bacterium]